MRSYLASDPRVFSWRTRTRRSVGAAETPPEAKRKAAKPKAAAKAAGPGEPRHYLAAARMMLTKSTARRDKAGIAKWEARIGELLRKHSELRPVTVAKPAAARRTAIKPPAVRAAQNGNGKRNGNGK